MKKEKQEVSNCKKNKSFLLTTEKRSRKIVLVIVIHLQPLFHLFLSHLLLAGHKNKEEGILMH